jgi:hypothetical protein
VISHDMLDKKLPGCKKEYYPLVGLGSKPKEKRLEWLPHPDSGDNEQLTFVGSGPLSGPLYL